MQEYQEKVIDLHNDLLSYLSASPNNTPHDVITGSSIEHLHAGNISHLGLAVFSETVSGSEESLRNQYQVFLNLLRQYAHDFSEKSGPDQIQITMAIENCSSFASEEEPLCDVFHRFDSVLGGKKPLYASLTWNFENRFGGGALSTVGLKTDGKRLLDFCNSRVFAVDLSHASDALAGDILKYLDETKSPLRVIASHSNFRSVRDVPRNIPDEIAREVVARGGVIGLTCIKRFIGDRFEDYFRHVDYAVKRGWQDSLAIGADFFWPANCSRDLFPEFSAEHYFEGFKNISALQKISGLLRKEYGSALSQKISWANAFEKLIFPFEKALSSYI